MSKRFPQNTDDDRTDFLGGLGFADAVVTLSLFVLGGLGAAIVTRCFTVPFWWAMRLHFLGQSDVVLASYRIDNPKKERLHARLAGIFLGIAVICASLPYFHFISPKWVVLAAMAFVLYFGLTCAYFGNRRDDPVLYGWG